MKKELKGFVCGVMATAMVVGGATFAAGQWKTIDVLENDITVMVDGKQVTENNFVYNDRTYLPLRAVAEAVGKSVDYDDATNTAYIGSKPINDVGNIKTIISPPLDTEAEVKDIYFPNLDYYSKGNFYAKVNSVDGVSVNWCAKNLSDKTIKYINITIRLYNAVDDIITDDFGRREFNVSLVGPVEPGQGFKYQSDAFAYTKLCKKLSIDEISVEFMDGTIVNGLYDFSTERVR